MSGQVRIENADGEAGRTAGPEADPRDSRAAGRAESAEEPAEKGEAAVPGPRPVPAPAVDLGVELPEDPRRAVEALLDELASARAAADEAEDKWKRTAAEFDNYRRRARRDQAELIARSSERVASRMLPVLDSLDAALVSESVASAEAGIREGMSGTRDLLLSVLAGEGLAQIEALGGVFDPALHEAAQIGEGEGTMVVTAELRRGYTLAGRVVRASLVVVGYQPAGESGESGEIGAAEAAAEDRGSV